VRYGKLMSIINICLPEVPPCLAIQNYINGSTQCHAIFLAQQATSLGFGVVEFQHGPLSAHVV